MILNGTAGWSCPDWEGAVYPRGASATARLRAVADYLDCVEVDISFHRPPTARITANWVRLTADRPGFRFLIKAWQRFTHERDRPWTPVEQQFLTDGLEPLRAAGRLDALLFQFPWSFRNQPVNRDWLARLGDAFAGWPVAMEFRHDSWTPALCRERGWIYYNIDQPALAHCLPPTTHVTADIAYWRLHGRNAANWFKEKQDVYGGRYDHLYNAAELDELWGKVRATATAAKLFEVKLKRDGSGLVCGLEVKERKEKMEWARQARGAYLLRTNEVGLDGAQFWKWYVQLTQAEGAFRVQKSDLGLRPVFHQKTDRVRGHILVCFLALSLWRVLEQWMASKGLGNCCQRWTPIFRPRNAEFKLGFQASAGS